MVEEKRQDGLSPEKLAALAAARAKRRIATEEVVAPEGWRSVDHLLDDTREFVGRFGLTMELARYLGVTDGPVRRWLRREKKPRQETVDAIAAWRRVKAR